MATTTDCHEGFPGFRVCRSWNSCGLCGGDRNRPTDNVDPARSLLLDRLEDEAHRRPARQS